MTRETEMTEMTPMTQSESIRIASEGDDSRPERNAGGKPGPDGKPTQTPPKMRRQFMTWILVLALIAVIWTVLTNSSQRGETVQTPQEFFVLAKEGYFEPASVVIQDDKLMATLAKALPGATERTGQKGGQVWVRIIPGNYDWVREQLTTAGVKWQEQVGQSMFMQLLLTLAAPLLILVVLWFLIARSMRSAGGGGPGGMLGSFGKSRHRVTNKENVKVTFGDVAGVDEAKEEVQEIVEFLKTPKRFSKLGGRIPRGILLSGQPGCGKTLLAKAIAGEADVPFFSISGSDFVEMFVGVGASRVRDLFKQAKDNSPCIIFLDEIDAVGRRRGGGFSSGGHDEREQTLNAILVAVSDRFRH